MPTAGDEGYEKLVICPYDKSHEIRRGRMQFHLEKCRRNYPNAQLVDCPYNKGHLVPKQELNYHMEEECESRVVWERFSHEREEKIPCPVKDLVPVNAATVPDGGENWDDFEAVGSVLGHIKAEAEEKPIFRMLQVASKSKRKAFRAQERKRHNDFKENGIVKPKESEISKTASAVVSHPKHKTLKPSNLGVIRQEISTAWESMNKQLKSLDINKPPSGDMAPSEASFMSSPSDYETASTSRQFPFSYAQASGDSHTGSASRPASSVSNSSMMTALSHVRPQHSITSRPSTAMSSVSSSSYCTASQGGSANRPSSPMSNSSLGSSSISSMTAQRPPNSSTYRTSTAMNIATSAASYNRENLDEDGFCQIPIPGLGRGRRRQLD